MYLKSLNLAAWVFVALNSAVNADEIEWRYFAMSGNAESIEDGGTGFLLCAHPQWDETVTEATKSHFRRNNSAEFAAVPDPEDLAYECMGMFGSDVIAINWTLVMAERDPSEYTKKIMADGLLREVDLPDY